jgi:MFS transporter, DHA1 family, multidrug resistance protein
MPQSGHHAAPDHVPDPASTPVPASVSTPSSTPAPNADTTSAQLPDAPSPAGPGGALGAGAALDQAVLDPAAPHPAALDPEAALHPDAASDGSVAASRPGLAQRRTSLLVTFVLGGLTALPAFSMDMYLPALPKVSQALHSSAAVAQLTLTACLAGMALGQLVVGPMSDKLGRRRPLLIGMVIYLAATVVCAFAPNAELLITFRLLQGLAGASAIVIARAVVRDLYDGVAMARFFSTLMLISGVAPIVAPVVGGQVLRVTDWRGVFVVLSVIGMLLTLVVWRWMGETLPPERRHSGGLGETLHTMRKLLSDRVFTGYMLAGSFAFAALFAYVSGSSFVIQEIYGASPQTFSLLFGLNSVGLVLFGQVNGKILVGRVSFDKALSFGLAVITLASIALLLVASGVFGHTGIAPVAGGFFVLM